MASLVVSVDTSERGVRERAFEVVRDDRRIHGMLWQPAAADTKGIVLLGHGGGQHKRHAAIVSIARRLVRHHGLAVTAIDHLPGHGDQPPIPEFTWWGEEREQWMTRPPREYKPALIAAVAALPVDSIVEDWIATIDVVTREVNGGPIGYLGLSGGAGIGYVLVARDRRIAVAALGLAGVEMFPFAAAAAPAIEVPTLCFAQSDDQEVPRDSALALFDLVGCREKVFHLNPGGHAEVPAQEIDTIERFLVATLTS